MDKKKAGRKRSYKSYIDQYNAKKRQLEANGVQMNQRLLTEKEFDSAYNRVLLRRKQDVASGKRKTTGNITREIVDKQAFALSAKQAEAMKDNKYNYYEKRSGLALEMFYEEKKNAIRI